MEADPRNKRLSFAIASILSVASLAVATVIITYGLTSWGKIGTDAGGWQGDFFGGHFGSGVGAITLGVVIWTSYLQLSRQQTILEQERRDTRRFFLEQSLLQGVDLISQWELKESGGPQAMRLLDHFSRVALAENDDELLLLLNTVMTAEIRKNLESTGYLSTSYSYAAEAHKKIGELRKSREMARKNPSTLPARGR